MIACVQSLCAQSVQGYVSMLRMAEAQSGARTTVAQDGVSTRALDGVRAQPDKVRGMRVNVFFGSEQNARAAAEAARSQLAKLFPGVPSYMTYEAPFFKVQAGDCLNRVEATALKGRLESVFSNANIVNETIPLSKFMEQTVVPEFPEGMSPDQEEEDSASEEEI